MVYSSLLANTTLRTQRTALPRVFSRHKSITAAIERGRQHSSRDQRFGSRTPPSNALTGFGDRGAAPGRGRRTNDDFSGRRHDQRGSREDRAPRPRSFDRSHRPEQSKYTNYKEQWGALPRSETDAPRRQGRSFGGTLRPGGSEDTAYERKPAWNRDSEPSSERTSRPDRARSAGRTSGPTTFRERGSTSSWSKEKSFDNRSQPSDGDSWKPREREDSFRDRRTERRDEKSSRPRQTDDTFRHKRTEEGVERGFRPRQTEDTFRDRRTERRDDRSSRSRQGAAFRNRDFEQDDETRSKPRQTEDTFRDRRTERHDERSSPTRQTEGTFSDQRTEKGDERSSRPRQTEDTAGGKRFERAPESLPYTTAASEFLHGHSSVLAALKAKRRKLFKLYIHDRGMNHEGREAIVQYARSMRLPIQEVGDEHLRAMDRMTNGRPHNGFILESSPLPVPPITELKSSSVISGTFELALDRQSKEDEAVNGKKTMYSYTSAGWRHPLVLYVDGVLDEGNLGAIARSAYFLGVDAIVTASRQSAPWSHVTLKASAGAAEAMPIFSVGQATDFLGKSARAGWRIYASAALPPIEQRAHSVSTTSEPSLADFASSVIYTYAKSPKRLPADHCPVDSHPTILMMGSESTGLRTSLLNMAHYKVGIRHGRDADEVGVDSLNVSVAASLLCYNMLQKPLPKRNAGELLF